MRERTRFDKNALLRTQLLAAWQAPNFDHEEVGRINAELRATLAEKPKGEPMTPWTDERVQLLKTLWDKGYSGGQCAHQLNCGMTRNAIIGKISRLGLLHRKNSNNEAFVKNPRHNCKPTSPTVVRRMRESKPELPPTFPVAEIEAKPAPKGFLGLLFDDLRLGDNRCRFIQTVDGVHLFCGQPTITESSYCRQCHKRCHKRCHTRAGGYEMNISDAERERRRRSGAASPLGTGGPRA